jgi:hypothetical protein
LNRSRTVQGPRDLKQHSRVHDKVAEVQSAIFETASIRPEIANENRWTMLTIWRAMLTIRRAILTILRTMFAITQVTDKPGRVQFEVTNIHGK